jgi:hypothetical protein
MQQMEIQYFFPLTEQIDLDLDFTPCQEYAEAKRQEQLKNSVLYTGSFAVGNGGTSWSTTNVAPTFQFHPSPITVGYWTVAENVQVHQEKKPRWVVRKMSELLLGWKWMDK